ncbi:MAG: hypothetical protein H6845_00235 [Alphaproteobacteria bacterium]|nr:MAG: hypothetical protein H6845_00235 [Alphaproteobacteria bacterium]
MSHKDLLLFKRKLEVMEQELLSEIKELTTKHYNERTSEELEAVSNSLANEMLFLELRKKQEVLKQVKFALLRIKKGVYGICTKTGNQISLKRLHVNPTALCDI